jgi:fatty acid desaturase
MDEQNYLPWRRSLLDRETLRSLSTPDFALNIRTTFWFWGQILIAWAVAAHFDRGWLNALCACFVGNRYYALYILGHDGLHRRLCSDPRKNDLWNDLFLIGPLGAVTRINRSNHMTHHGSLNLKQDPDAYKYADRRSAGRLAYLFGFSAIPYVLRAIRNVYSSAGDDVHESATHRPPGAAKKTLREFAIVVGWQVLLVGGLSWTFGWWGYPVMWLLPVYVFTFCADMARVYCEHSAEGLSGQAELSHRLRDFDGSPIERALLSPLNMNHHVAHHLWPSIPWHSLPAATLHIRRRVDELRSQCPSDTHPEFGLSYFAVIGRGLRGNDR